MLPLSKTSTISLFHFIIICGIAFTNNFINYTSGIKFVSSFKYFYPYSYYHFIFSTVRIFISKLCVFFFQDRERRLQHLYSAHSQNAWNIRQTQMRNDATVSAQPVQYNGTAATANGQ